MILNTHALNYVHSVALTFPNSSLVFISPVTLCYIPVFVACKPSSNAGFIHTYGISLLFCYLLFANLRMDESWMYSWGNWLFFVMYKRDVCQCLSLNDKSFMENLWFALLWNFKGKENKLNMWFQFPNLPYF